MTEKIIKCNFVTKLKNQFYYCPDDNGDYDLSICEYKFNNEILCYDIKYRKNHKPWQYIKNLNEVINIDPSKYDVKICEHIKNILKLISKQIEDDFNNWETKDPIGWHSLIVDHGKHETIVGCRIEGASRFFINQYFGCEIVKHGIDGIEDDNVFTRKFLNMFDHEVKTANGNSIHITWQESRYPLDGKRNFLFFVYELDENLKLKIKQIYVAYQTLSDYDFGDDPTVRTGRKISYKKVVLNSFKVFDNE